MEILDDKELFEIRDSDVSFDNLKGVFGSIEHDVSSVDILAIPVDSKYSESNRVFHNSIGDIYDYFVSESKDAKFDVYSDDGELEELMLHSDDWWLGSFLLTSVFIPGFVNLITNYIYDVIKAKNDDNISIEVIVDNGKKGSKAVNYRGKVGNLQKAIDALEKLK